VYNLVENLCMSKGMTMPKVNIIEDDSLNAFASGINNSTYTVSLSRGIIRKLDDDELQGVIAHELSHIRNRDVRVLSVSSVFVGIFAMLTQLAFRALRAMLHAPRQSRSNNGKNQGGVIVVILIALAVAIVGYFFASLMRFAISRKREYLADAAGAEMTQNPQALASALRKISRDPDIEAVTRDDVAQLFIEHPRKKKPVFAGISGLFATHPPIEKRIALLEQF
jgi:heat shock protein HtpX